MRPGLHADDIYIMVEDELHSIARQFTAHLHHAEYQRLKNLARTKSSSAIKEISRPVDSITAMRAETKRKKASEAQDARTNAVLEKLRAKAERHKVVDGDEDEESEFDEDEGKEQPWQGTHLHKYMVKSPKKKGQMSLTGLEGVKSHTRAAKGFERRGGSPSPRKTNGWAGRLDSFRNETRSEEEEDDDDLDAPIRAPSTIPAPAPNPSIIQKSDKTAPPRPPVKRSFLDMTPIKPSAPPPTATTTNTQLTAKSKAYQNPVPPYEPAAVDTEELREEIATAELLARRKRMKMRREKERKISSEAGIKLDEIPVFLV